MDFFVIESDAVLSMEQELPFPRFSRPKFRQNTAFIKNRIRLLGQLFTRVIQMAALHTSSADPNVHCFRIFQFIRPSLQFDDIRVKIIQGCVLRHERLTTQPVKNCPRANQQLGNV
jgi:hypothetical protein